MIETELDRRPSGTSVGIVAAVAGLFTVATAVTAGAVAVLSTLVALAGVALLTWGWSIVAVDPGTTPTREVALASVAATAGSLGLLVPLVWLSLVDALLLLPLVCAVLFVGIEGVGRIQPEPMRWLTRLCWRSRDLVALFALLVLATDTGVLWAVTWGSVYGTVLLIRTTSAAALVVLLAECYLLLYFLPRARAVLEQRFGLDSRTRLQGVVVGSQSLDRLLESIRARVVTAWRASLAVVVLLVVGRNVFDQVLLSVPVVGPPMVWLLTSGVVHLLVAAVLLPAMATVALGYLHAVLVTNRYFDPSRALASGAGGAVVGLLTLPTVLIPASATRSVFPPSLTQVAVELGPGTVVLAGIALVLLVLPILLNGVPFAVSGLSLTDARTAGFVTAGLLVLSGTVIGALLGVFVPLVFVGVAVAMLTWDLGAQASYLGVHLGRDTDTRGPELVHAFGSVAVGVVGVTLAAVVAYLVGSVGLPTASGRAYVALALALVAALGFSLSLSGE